MEPASGAIGEVATTAVEVGTKSVPPVVENVAQVAAPTAETATGSLKEVPDVNQNTTLTVASDANIIQGLEEKVAAIKPDSSAQIQGITDNGAQESNVGDQQAAQDASSPMAEANVSKQTAEQEVPDEIKNDPLYQQELGKAMLEAQKNGEPLDQQKLSQEALGKYNKEKALSAETETQKPEETASVENRLTQLENRLNKALTENGQLKTELTKLNMTMMEILPAIKVLLETAQAKEEEPKKKETLAQLLIKIIGIIAVSTVMEAGKVVVPPLGQTQG